NPITATITATPVVKTFNYAFLTNRSNAVSVLDLASNTITGPLSTSQVIAFAIAPGGVLAYATTPTSVLVINTVTNTVINQFPIAPPSIEFLQLVISPDGSRLYLSNTLNGKIDVMDAGTGQMITTLSVPPDLLDALAISADGTRLYVAED